MIRATGALRIEPMPIERLLEEAPVFVEALEWHRACLGRAAHASDAFEALLPDLQLFAQVTEGAPYLHCGQRTTTAEIYGADFATRVVGQRDLPGEPAARALSAVYAEAAAGRRPIAQHVRIALTIGGLTHLVGYHRLVLPLRLSLGPAAGVVTRFATGRS